MPQPFALLDVPGGGAFLFEGLLTTLVVSTPEDFAALCADAEVRAESGQHVVAALDYELGKVFEPRSGIPPAGGLGNFWVFSERRFLPPEALASWFSEMAGDPPRPATVLDFQPGLDEPGHAQAVARIRDYIAAGDCYQVNFTFPFSGTCLGDPIALYARLRAAQPVAHGGLVVFPEGCILSLSPELFIERENGLIRSRPMKGTASRSENAAADDRALAALQTSAKDRAENVMIVDLIRNDLGRVAQPGSVCVESVCEIERYPSVYQMTSTVTAACNAPLPEVLAALFPCGSITGAPKVRAMQIIGELEQVPRGLYTGALGWIGNRGGFCFNVAIRTLLVDAESRVRYGVGSGIVWDSQAASEYAECLLKASFVMRAAPGFRLIETLRLSEGEYPQQALHLDRLQSSAQALGFSCDVAVLQRLLDEFAHQQGSGVFRVRLTLGRAGDVELSVGHLLPTAGAVRAVLSPHRINSREPWLRYKTTVRDLYEQELERVQGMPSVFDAIFLNERGEVCEGARSNVFVRMAPGEPLLTPPLGCGLLPGVLRRQLLESGEALERMLREADLRNATELYLGNALRGLVRVLLED
ncbi:MAG: para-aminobenzoate synthetase / 4-amino-4-deoxychorismate lyase [Pseudomonadota bacterium]|nr:para-aminobenzoate synthetase / 4-amino-4-deoxychorismate lyase [Pseudomonadota bacterium]